jgi:hypothetical protein
MKKCPTCLKTEDNNATRFCNNCGAELFYPERFESGSVGVKTKVITISTRLPAAADRIWGKLQEISTLQYIAAPYATFKPADAQLLEWEEGNSFKFHLRVFGFLPMGVHTINVAQFNRDTLTIYTNESNNHVPVWNYRILLKVLDDGTTDYTDEVEIYASWKTQFIVLWSSMFYRHRQRKWHKLLEGDNQ